MELVNHNLIEHITGNEGVRSVQIYIIGCMVITSPVHRVDKEAMVTH